MFISNRRLPKNIQRDIEQIFRGVRAGNAGQNTTFSKGEAPNSLKGTNLNTMTNAEKKKAVDWVVKTLAGNNINVDRYPGYSILFREVPDISRYTQNWHKNANASVQSGVFEHQIIYYLDDLPPNLKIRMTNQNSVLNRILREEQNTKRTRNANNRGKIARIGGQLVTSNGKNLKVVRPEAGRAISFAPNKTWHKVVPIGNRGANAKPIPRRMIIIALRRPFVQGMNQAGPSVQIRPGNFGQQYLNRLVAQQVRSAPEGVRNNNQTPTAKRHRPNIYMNTRPNNMNTRPNNPMNTRPNNMNTRPNNMNTRPNNPMNTRPNNPMNTRPNNMNTRPNNMNQSR